MHYVANMSFETCLASCHCSQNSFHTASHYHMKFWIWGATKERTDCNCVHWQLLFEVSVNLQGFWIQDLWAIVSSSTQNTEIFAEADSIDFGSFMNERSDHKLSLIVISANVAIISTDEYTFIINVPEGLARNLLRFGILRFDNGPELEFWLNIFRIHFAFGVGRSIEQLFKVKDFNNGGNTNSELVTDGKQFGRAVVKFDMF